MLRAVSVVVPTPATEAEADTPARAGAALTAPDISRIVNAAADARQSSLVMKGLSRWAAQRVVAT